MLKYTLFAVIAVILVGTILCEELLINIAKIPTDAIITTAGDKPINILIPSQGDKKLFSIKFDTTKLWVNNTVGMMSYQYNVTFSKPIYYPNNTGNMDYIENIAAYVRKNYRTTDEKCPFTASVMQSPYISSYVNCTTFMTVYHNGYKLLSGDKIGNEYYPMIVRIEPIANRYTTSNSDTCKPQTYSTCARCPCVSTGGTNFDESYFYVSNKVGSSVSSSSFSKFNSNYRFLSMGSSIEQNLMMIILLICFIFTINV